MSRTRAVLTALIVVSALGLVGCSDDDPEPTFAPPSSDAPSSAGATEAAAQLSPEDTVRAWVEARNRALTSGDTAEVEALSAEACRTCENSIDPIREVHAHGGSFKTEGWIVDSLVVKDEAEKTVTVSAAVTYASGETMPSAGAEPVTYEEEKHILLVRLGLVDRRWLIEDLGYVS